MTRRARLPAFTLIELLVVVAVIAVLAALLFPVFAQAREKARSARCVSNLRQLTMAIHEYMQDWEGGLPEFYQAGSSPEQWVSFRWFGHIMPYLKDREILHCPADPIRNGLRAVDDARKRWADLPVLPALSYGFNFWLQQSRETTIALPADTVLLGDGAWLQCLDARPVGGTANSSCYAYANGTRAASKNLTRVGQAGEERHGNGSNIAFFDGHVRFIPADQFRKRRQGVACAEYPLVQLDCELWK